MDLIFNHPWVLFITVTIANAFLLKYRSKKYISKNPELKEGYEKAFLGFLIYGNLPWVIMMVGDLSGLTHGIFEYFNPKALNPIVLALHLSIILLWVLSVRWIYFKNGAEFIETHPGLIQKSSLSGTSNVSAKQVKQFLPLMLLGGVIGMVMMWIMNP